MATKKTNKQIRAEALIEGREQGARELAARMERPADSEAVSPKRERELFWASDLEPHQADALWGPHTPESLLAGLTAMGVGQQVMGRVLQTAMQRGITAETLAMGLSPQQVSQLVYPVRWEMLDQGGRVELPDQVTWAERHARLGPPEPKAEPVAVPVEAPVAQGQTRP